MYLTIFDIHPRYEQKGFIFNRYFTTSLNLEPMPFDYEIENHNKFLVILESEK